MSTHIKRKKRTDIGSSEKRSRIGHVADTPYHILEPDNRPRSESVESPAAAHEPVVTMSDVRTKPFRSPLNEDRMTRWLRDAKDQLNLPPLEVMSIWKTLHSGNPPLIFAIQDHISCEAVFTEFLGLLDLYCEQVVDAESMCLHVKPFLGNNLPLYERFCRIVQEDVLSEEFTKPTHPRQNNHGPSYRLIPVSTQQGSCQGRDQVCWEVLNDEYVSHPQWASEDAGFLSSKKNTFEERLQNVEDEQYELDLELNNVWDAYCLLRDCYEKYIRLSATARRNYTLTRAVMGHLVVLLRVIKSAAPRDMRPEIWRLLKNSPGENLEPVIKNLKSKYQDLLQLKNNRMKGWRDTVSKNYYKSLDYQSAQHRLQTDPPSLSTLVSEIDLLYHEQLNLKHHTPRPSSSTNLPGTLDGPPDITPAQFNFWVDDASIVVDIIQLAKEYVHKDSFYKHKAAEIIPILEEMLPSCLGISRQLLDQSTSIIVRKNSHCFTNESFYGAIRYCQLLMESLKEIKMWSKRFEQDAAQTKVTLATPSLDLTLLPVPGVTVKSGASHYDLLMRVLIARLGGGIDHNTMEDGIRFLFGIKGYLVFSAGRLIHGICKQIHQFLNHPLHEPMIELYEKYGQNKSQVVAYLEASKKWNLTHLFLLAAVIPMVYFYSFLCLPYFDPVGSLCFN
ncbi:hypothetical protein DM01DRAFT_1339814 [Hesseltinella vesiculosa]|uniref:Histone deacetylase interacting domain-containing protein n=1 Tax=Hesseltinella vesiculosa TaxID=101127 RepID=A0A1X2G5T7_9FUNG|nr:hypothetical protein DM01DRAFT_1339814 [Hesseltinella vesiculosa]